MGNVVSMRVTVLVLALSIGLVGMPSIADERLTCYRSYDNGQGVQVHTLNFDAEGAADCRLYWKVFVGTLSIQCPNCFVKDEQIFRGTPNNFQTMKDNKSVGWPYSTRGNVRTWVSNVDAEFALKYCKDVSRFSVASKSWCVE